MERIVCNSAVCLPTIQQLESAGGDLELIERTLRGRLIGAPAYRTRAVADALTCHLIECDFENELRSERDLRTVALGIATPTRRAAWCVARKAGPADERREAFEKCGALGV